MDYLQGKARDGRDRGSIYPIIPDGSYTSERGIKTQWDTPTHPGFVEFSGTIKVGKEGLKPCQVLEELIDKVYLLLTKIISE